MALSVDWGNTFVITVPQSDLTLVTGALYDFDTDAFRLELKSLEDDEVGMPWPSTHIHNTEVTVAGVTYARFIEIVAPYSITFEDTGSAYAVRFINSNNNAWDVENGILNVTPKVSYIPTNSAGLIVVESVDAASISASLATILADLTGLEEYDLAERITNPSTGKLEIVNDTAMRRWEADAWQDSAKTVPYVGTGLEAVGEITEIAY